MMIPRYYEDLSILHDNTMPMRSYYIPASQKMNTLIEHREDSDRFQLLNGVWKFQYYKSVYDLKEAFYRTSFNAKDFDDITVPGVCIFSLVNSSPMIARQPPVPNFTICVFLPSFQYT